VGGGRGVVPPLFDVGRSEAFAAAAARNRRVAYLTKYTPSDLAGKNLFLSQDEDAGFAIPQDGVLLTSVPLQL
jgi:hypothetical protein